MGFSLSKSGVAVAVFWGAMTIGRIVCGKLTYRFSLRHIIITLAFFSAIFTVVTSFAVNEVIVWAAIAFMGFSYSSQWPFIASFGSKQTKAPSGTVFALLVGSGGVGGTAIPYIMGFAGEKIDLRLVMAVPAFALLIVGVIIIGMREKNKEAL